jgi:hypothetical protein
MVDGKKWYKIAPPSGEFRWIHASNVQRVSVTPPVVAQPIITVPLPENKAEPRDATQSAEAAVTLASDSQPQAETDWRAAPVEPKNETKNSPPAESSSEAAKAAGNSSNGEPAAVASADSASPPTQTPTPADAEPSMVATSAAAAAAAPAQAAPAQAAPPFSTSSDLARQLTDIELRLSRTVAEPPETWRIEPLRQETQQLLAGASDQANRAAIGATLAKLDRFAAIAHQYQRRAQTASSSNDAPITPIPYGAGSGDPRTMGSGDPRTTQPVTAESQNYDAVGVLRPVVSKRPGAPQFALVDERGQVISFVTPSPDVNLQPYLGRRIGVTGSRGYIPEFQRAHVMAGRVAPLSDRMVR